MSADTPAGEIGPEAGSTRTGRRRRDVSLARIVILAGPSGAGKSRLAARLHAVHGWPIVRLDDFYRDGNDPSMPRSARLGIVDWDHPDSWDRAAALTALETLARRGSAAIPVYDIAHSRATGTATVVCDPRDLVLAEGIFAAEIIEDLRRGGLLRAAYCVHRPRPVTFVWRLLRDLSERRKPPMVLVRRGLALMRDESQVVARAESLGAVSTRPAAVERELGAGQPVPR